MLQGVVTLTPLLGKAGSFSHRVAWQATRACALQTTAFLPREAPRDVLTEASDFLDNPPKYHLSRVYIQIPLNLSDQIPLPPVGSIIATLDKRKHAVHPSIHPSFHSFNNNY